MIRMMTKQDKSEVKAMMSTFYHSPAVLSDGSDEIYINDIENCINDNPYLEGFIIEHNGVMAGYAMIAKSFSTEFGKKCIWIEDLYVKEEYRGKGLGSEFFDYLNSHFKDAVFRLEVEDSNKTAVHVYKKNGFEIIEYMEMVKKV